MNRREFLILIAASVAGCSSAPPGTGPGMSKTRLINAGRARDYTADGVYSRYRSQGFFVIRRGDKLFVLSAICTHKRCKLNTEPDRSFTCPCHGSTFDPNGHVTEGPAKRDLPILETFTNGRGELVVRVPSA